MYTIECGNGTRQLMHEHYSNGLTYDSRIGMLIHTCSDRPHPHNQTRQYIERAPVEWLQGLTQQETDHLMAQAKQYKHTRRSEAAELAERLHAESVSRWKLELLEYKARSNYYWSDEHRNFHTMGRVVFHEWLKQHEPNTFHALWGTRKSLPGVARSNSRSYNDTISKKIVTQTRRKRSCKGRKTTRVTQR
jgi:hypothetical protein